RVGLSDPHVTSLQVLSLSSPHFPYAPLFRSMVGAYFDGSTWHSFLAIVTDTTPPTLTAVTESPSTGDLNAGKTITITLTTSEAVKGTGAPTHARNDRRTATYRSGKSTTTSLA